ncbi:MAG: cysteine desulfurase family protein [Vulcanimicrobiaceae bacterium]
MTRRIYLDHAATTPATAAVLAAMAPYLESANPSSLHAEGRAARAAVETARTTIARAVGASPREIVFTSGGSEANNLAIFGLARAARAARAATAGDGLVEPPHVVTLATEHHAVLHAVRALEREGFAISVLPVDANGVLDPGRFAAALRPQTVLAAVMLANNETGTVQPIRAFADVAREHGVRFHSDAVQAPGHLPCDVAELGVDTLAISGHKCGGPKGIGALVVRVGTPLWPLIVGGPQEAGRRAGTENVAGIVGFARALADATASRAAEAGRLNALRDRFEAACRTRIAGTHVNGAAAPRLPHVSSIAFAGVAAMELLVALDLAGVAISLGSACAAGSPEPSHVIAALGASPGVLGGTVRFSLGSSTSEQDVGDVVEMLAEIVAANRVASPEVGKAHNGLSSYSEVRS